MPTTPHETLLQECRELFCERLIEAVRRTFDAMQTSLAELAAKTTDEAVRKRYLDARELASRHRDVLEAQFRRRLAAEFQGRVDKSQAGDRMQSYSLEDLQLVGDDDLNETLSFNDMAAKVRSHCDEEMAALDQRAAVLLGKTALGADDNPFSAKVVAEAFRQACQQVDCPLDVRLVFVKSFERLALDGIRSTCREVNDLLVANAILPKIRYGVNRSEDRPKPPAPGVPKAANEESSAAKQDMFSMLSSMFGGQANTGATPGMGVGGAPLVEGAQLMGSLTSLQRGDLAALGTAAAELGPILAEAGNLQNVLRRLKDTSVGAGMGRMDAVTLDIVSMLFDALFEDHQIPEALKGLIGRLQLPILKVAIADKDLFSSKSHPARRLLDALGRIGLGLPQDFGTAHALFPQLESGVEAIVHGYRENLDIFDEVRAQLEQILAVEETRVANGMQAVRRQLDQVERLALAKAEVQEELRVRLAPREDLPWAIVEFVVHEWIKYLVTIRARDGRDSEEWRTAMGTTEKLLWSLEPKPTAEDRRQLGAALPGLVRGLKIGIAIAHLDEPTSAPFFSALLARHAEAIRPAAAPVSRKASAAKQPPEARPKKETLDFSRPVTLENPFGGGKVQVSDDDLEMDPPPAAMPAKPAPAQLPPPPAKKVRLPGAMVVGAWVKVEDPRDQLRKTARLHYVSPLKSHFLFVDRQGNKVYECSRTMLARRLKLGEVALLDGEPDASLFDRILEAIFGRMGRPLAKAA